MYDYVICGGGFKGAIAAILLAKKGVSVCIVEASPRLGGVLNSIPWNGYQLDIGCHLFDNSSAEFTDLMFEIHSDFMPIDVHYSSIVCDGSETEGMAVPDLTQLELDPDKVRNSLHSAIESKSKSVVDSYEDYLQARFGSYLSGHLSQCAQKKVGISPAQLSSSASASLLLDRVKCLDDQLSKTLKKDIEYDARIAVSSQTAPMQFYVDAAKKYPHRNYYPVENGMGSFCRSLERYVADLGIQVFYQDEVEEVSGKSLRLKSSTQIDARKILWTSSLGNLEKTLFNTENIALSSKDVSVVLLYFEVPNSKISDITYLHDYRSDSPSFRISASGKYGHQFNDGDSFVCSEVFTAKDSELWQLSEQNYQPVWQQLKETGVVTSKQPVSVKVVHAKSAYKLPALEYDAVFNKFRDRVADQFPNIMLDKSVGFSKQTMFEQASLLAQQL